MRMMASKIQALVMVVVLTHTVVVIHMEEVEDMVGVWIRMGEEVATGIHMGEGLVLHRRTPREN